MSTLDYRPLIDMEPPADVLTVRRERILRYLAPDRRMHKLAIRDLTSVDDVIINMGKAFQYSLLTGEGYKRPETPKMLREMLTRTGLVF